MKLDIKKIKETFDSLDDKGQWNWLVTTDLKDRFTLYLDNDCTHIYFADDHDADYVLEFKTDIGNRRGVNDLLESLGINVQDV